MVRNFAKAPSVSEWNLRRGSSETAEDDDRLYSLELSFSGESTTDEYGFIFAHFKSTAMEYSKIAEVSDFREPPVNTYSTKPPPEQDLEFHETLAIAEYFCQYKARITRYSKHQRDEAVEIVYFSPI
ncbi:hypothetical protein K4K60_001813 [Colletotrichum sp. SAR11_57]|nr:hypothetical protein K4K60_001813 [Colletotrichum sp. SAR11_57]